MKIHKLDGYIQNNYLVEYPDKLLLFDSGTKGDVDSFINFIQIKLKRNLSDLKIVFISHMHPDHSGGAMLLKKKTGCKLAAPKNLDQWYGGLSGSVEKSVDILLTYYVASRKNKDLKKNIFFSKNLKIDYLLEHNESLPFFSDWKAIKAPGHTDCDMNLLCEEKKLIYVADNIIRTNRGYITPYPMFDPKNYYNNLKFYETLKGYSFLLAHGGKRNFENIDFIKLKKMVSVKSKTHLSFIKERVLNKLNLGK